MKKNLRVGMSIEKRIRTEGEMAASRFHKDSPAAVLSTPSLVTFMQTTSADLLSQFLEGGEMAVSIRIEMNHLAATPIGMDVRIRAEIVRIEGRKVSFKVEAFDEVEKTSEGYHDMFVIDEERFDRGVAKKWENSRVSAGS